MISHVTLLLLGTSCLLGVESADKKVPSKPHFDSMPDTCKNDNWGEPKQSRKPFSYSYEKAIRIPCDAQWEKNWKPMSDLLEMATIIWYKDTDAYDNFTATDLVPENRHLYSGRVWGQESTFDFHTAKPKSFMASTCHLPQEDGSTWDLTRIGPFKTTGGYDWFQVGWDNLWNLGEVIKENPDGVYILQQFMSPVFANGTRINHPPVHIHHMHIGPAPYVRQRFNSISCITEGRGCFDPSRSMENHGDYNCIEDDGGLDCRTELFPPGYAKYLVKPLGLEGELNDVRPPGSEEITWYWQLGARWVLKTPSTSRELGLKEAKDPKAFDESKHVKAMSLQNIAGPGIYNIFHQKSYILTFPTPTRYESVFWYTGRLQFGGDLLRLKLHAHNNLFDQSLFFAASPEELGLTEANGYTPKRPFLPIKTSNLNQKNNEEVKRFLLENLKKSQEEFDGRLKAGQITRKTSDCGYPEAQCIETRPMIVCQAHGMLVEIDGFAYDRRQPTCCVPWEFETGQVFTVIGFNRHMGYPVGLHAPKKEDIPDYLPGHVGWWLSYDSKDAPEYSHWGYSIYNQEASGGLESTLKMTGYQKIAILFNGGTSTHWNDWSKTPNGVLCLVLDFLIHHKVLLVLTLGLVAYYLLRCTCLVKRVATDGVKASLSSLSSASSIAQTGVSRVDKAPLSRELLGPGEKDRFLDEEENLKL